MVLLEAARSNHAQHVRDTEEKFHQLTDTAERQLVQFNSEKLRLQQSVDTLKQEVSNTLVILLYLVIILNKYTKNPRM